MFIESRASKQQKNGIKYLAYHFLNSFYLHSNKVQAKANTMHEKGKIGEKICSAPTQ